MSSPDEDEYAEKAEEYDEPSLCTSDQRRKDYKGKQKNDYGQALPRLVISSIFFLLIPPKRCSYEFDKNDNRHELQRLKRA